jgi:hypothetical protein
MLKNKTKTPTLRDVVRGCLPPDAGKPDIYTDTSYSKTFKKTRVAFKNIANLNLPANILQRNIEKALTVAGFIPNEVMVFVDKNWGSDIYVYTRSPIQITEA